MRVLHVYSGNLFGGVETLLCSLAQCSALAPGVRREFALCFAGQLSASLEQTGATVHLLGDVRFRRPWSIVAARRRLGKILAGGSFSTVVCHSVWAQSIFGPVARAAGVPLVFWLHDAADGRHWLQRLAARTPPDLVIANSHYTRRTLPRLYPDVRSEVLYHPIRPDDRAPLSSDQRTAIRRELDTAEDAVVIIQSSRLERWKGHHLHLEALARIADDPRWACWMVGGAQRPHELRYLRELQQAARTLGIGDRVRFLGQRSDVQRLLAAADIHCQPNTGAEPFGITFIEALYSARPVVTTALGGPREIVDATCGVLVPPGDAGALGEALRRLVDDPVMRTRMGANGPKRAAELCDPVRQLGRLGVLCQQLGTST